MSEYLNRTKTPDYSKVYPWFEQELPSLSELSKEERIFKASLCLKDAFRKRLPTLHNLDGCGLQFASIIYSRT